MSLGSQSKQFGVIVADPPWEFRNQSNRGAARRHYETLPDDAIAALPVADLTRPDTVLILWALWAKLDSAIEILRAWGFAFKTGFPWLKLTDPPGAVGADLTLRFRLGVGWWIRGVSEPVLIGVRQSARPAPDPPVGIAFDTGIAGLGSIRFRHSQKPVEIHEFAERWAGPYLELFARSERAGWYTWGNEIRPVRGFAWEGIYRWVQDFGSG